MDSYQMMEWNAKWECDNAEMFCSKYNGTTKKLETTDWVMEEGDMDAGPFNLSGGSGCSASDIGHVSSTKSSVSASTECTSKEGIRASDLNFGPFGGFSAEFDKNDEFERTAKNSPSLDTSVGSAELLIGLKLGKRTYFENSAGNNSKTSSLSKIPVSSASTTKKRRPHCQNAPTLRCQVEACNLDLSSAKEYHRKHRVCESHSKCSKVIVGGLERRFCQQCSRFHGLSEFDEKKRSCRRRLSDHNARRRKPQNETVMSSIYEGRQQMSFVSTHATLSKSGPAGSSYWESLHSCNYELPTATGYVLKPEICSPVDVQSHLPGSQLPIAIDIPNQSSSRLWQRKGNLEGLNQVTGHQEHGFPSTDLHRALSLLSTNSWVSCDHESVNHSTSPSDKNIPHHVMRAVHQGSLLASPECWQTEVQSPDTRTRALTAINSSGGNYQEIQHFSVPYSTGFYSN